MPKPVPWMPKEDLDRMQRSLEHNADITRAALAERIVEDAAPAAAYAIVEIIQNSEDDNVKLSAAKYILDRANGKPKTSMQLNVSETNPVLQILDGVVVDRPKPATFDQDPLEDSDV
jgi:hypothetical protein